MANPTTKKDLVVALLEQAEWAEKHYSHELARCWDSLARYTGEGYSYDRLHRVALEQREEWKRARYYVDDYKNWAYIVQWFDEHAEQVDGKLLCLTCGRTAEYDQTDGPTGSECCPSCGETSLDWLKAYTIYDGR